MKNKEIVRASELDEKRRKMFEEAAKAGWGATIDFFGKTWRVNKVTINNNSEDAYELVEYIGD